MSGSSHRRRSFVRTLAVATCFGLAVVTGQARAVATEVTAQGTDGQVIAASTDELAATGTNEVHVDGSGFDESKGIYVAVCVVPTPGETPTPCLGGVDTSGDSGMSAWISSNPPSYGEGLARPYDADGSFALTLAIRSKDRQTDCLDPADAPRGCAIVARADHTRTDDRTQDVVLPLTFRSDLEPVTTTTDTGRAAQTSGATTDAASGPADAIGDQGSVGATADDLDDWQLVAIGVGIGLALCIAYALGAHSRRERPE